MDKKELKNKVLLDIFNNCGEKEILTRYKISHREFIELKNIILQELKAKTNKAEITSFAIRYFRDLISKKKFTETIKDYNITVSQTKTLYRVVQGNIRATYGLIFILRKYISPAKWVYMEDEKLVLPIKFNSTHNKKYTIETRQELAREKTLANIYLDILRANRVILRFCLEKGLSRDDVTNFFYMRVTKEKVEKYLMRPTLPIITKLKREIHPDYWFIYPDEVEKKVLKQVENSALEIVELFKQ